MYTQPKCTVLVLLRGTVQQVYENTVRCRRSSRRAKQLCCLGVVHLVYDALRYLPGSYSLLTHSMSALFGSYFGELFKPYSRYENTVHQIALHGVLNSHVRSRSRTP